MRGDCRSGHSWLQVLPLAVIVSCGLSIARAQENVWTGSTSTDWNTAGNWSLGNVPTAQNAIVDSTPANIATISADLSATPNDIVVRGGGRLDHTAGTAGTGGGSWMFVGQDSTLSIYNLADTSVGGSGITGYGQGTGTVNATGNFQLAAWGGNRVGTMNINTTGALNVTGGLRVGNDGGSVGVMNLEAGAVIVANSNTVYAGTENNIGHAGGVATLNISGGSLSVSDVLRLGNESGGNGTITMTGGVITKLGNGQFLVGHNNGVGVVVQSGGAISVNNELYIGNENAGASGTYTLSGTGALDISNEVVVGREGGTGVLNVNGGTITTTGNGNLYIGRRNGTGTLNQSDGVISVNREFGVGTRDGDQIGTGTFTLSGGSLAATNAIFIGKELGSSGTMTMTGGTMSTSDKLQIGHNQATGVVTQSGGVVNVQNEVYIGNETSASSVGTYTLSGSAELNVGNEVLVGRDNGTGTLNLDGGTVTTKKIEGGTGNATVNFNGGILKARENQAAFIANLDVANVQAGGIKIDSNGFDIATSQALAGPGGLEKVGAGSLTLSASNTYTGPTTVSAGTLEVATADAVSGSAVTVDSGARLAVGSGVTMKAPSVTVSGGTIAGGTLAVNTATGIGTLTINSGTIANTSSLVVGAGGLVDLPDAARVTLGVAGLSVTETSGGGKVDLGAGELAIAAGGISAADLRADIIAGLNGGNWDGTTGITSATAAASGGTRAVGYAVAGDGSARVSFAAPGDTNLDGQVDLVDLLDILGSGTYQQPVAAVWNQGDFNYDGVTDLLDLLAILGSGTYDQGTYFPAAPSATSLSGSIASVPEPGTWALASAAVAAALAVARRRRA